MKGRSWDVESSIKVVCEAEGESAGRIATLVEVGKGYHPLDDSRTRRSARHRSGSIGFVRQFWGSGVPARCRKSLFNSVIRFRIYLTPGEFGLPTRYTHPPPTPTPHMGEHCTAEDTACTHSFVTHCFEAAVVQEVYGGVQEV